MATLGAMRKIVLPIAAVLAIAGCGGGGGSASLPLPMPSASSAPSTDPTSVPTMTPNSPIVPSSASISLVGFGATVQLGASETGYAGDFIAASSNAAVAAVTPALASAGRAMFTVSAVNGGTATIAISDARGNTTTVSVGVTTTATVINAKHREP